MPKNKTSDIIEGLESWVQDMQTAVGGQIVDIPEDVGQWALQSGIVLDRGPFTFKKHEYLQTPYSDNHPYQVDRKCTQMGNTIRGILRAFHGCLIHKDWAGFIYLFPSGRGSGAFSRSRIGPLLRNNPDSLGKYIKETDSVELKRVAGKNAYFRGARSEESLLSDPADLIVYDEFRLFPEGMEGAARGRLAHSEYKWQHFLSNPGYPNNDIDKKFQETDQRYWLLKCPKCGKHTCMEDHVDMTGKNPPECLVERDDRVVRLCMKCRDAELDPAVGQWVAKKPSVLDARGYQYSQLWSQFIDPGSIYKDFMTGAKLQSLYNFVLGLPFVASENRMSKEEVLQLCSDYGLAASDSGPCYMGVDQGNYLHVVIGRHHSKKIVHVGHYLHWEDLPSLMRSFNVAMCVVDGLPEQRNARAFAKKFPGKVFLNFYNVHQKGNCVWNEARMTVSGNRTETLDDSQEALKKAKIILPKACEPVEEFATHAGNTARKIEEDEDGNKWYSYVNLGPDHYRHAFNYAWIARSRIAGSYFGGADLS